MFCPKCGARYDEDAKYCERCGESLQKSIHERNVLSKEKDESSGMSSSVKALIVVCILLIAGIGVTAGMLLQKPINTTAQVASSTQPSTSQSNQPAWHQVANYTGPDAVNGTFSIQGTQFKVTISAVPMITYNTNYLDVAVGSGNYLAASGTLSWTATESPAKKESVISVSQGQGTYDIEIDPTDIQNYTVTVWDYY
jgi:hypothetical protein